MRKKLIINIGRQIGSGGRIIAKLLAEEFDCKFYDREILNLAAKESGFSEKFFEQNDEQIVTSIRVTSRKRAFINSKVMLYVM